MSGNEYVKYITEEITAYLDMPTYQKKERRRKHKRSKAALSNRWFGMLPVAMKMFWKKAN